MCICEVGVVDLGWWQLWWIESRLVRCEKSATRSSVYCKKQTSLCAAGWVVQDTWESLGCFVKVDEMGIEVSLDGLKDYEPARTSRPAVGIHSSAIACGMISTKGMDGDIVLNSVDR